jgi:hypothetical protein
MKKRILLFTSSIVLFSALTMSYESGPAHSPYVTNYTGGPGSVGTCANAGCHTGSQVATPTSCAIEVRKLSTGTSGPIVTAYQADTVYIVTVTGSNTAGSLTRFGFNFMALRASNTTLNAGTYSSFPTNVDDNAVGGRNIVEHTAALMPTSGVYTVSFNWTAPVTGTGSVNMYAIINAVNNDGNASPADKPSPAFSMTLPEATTSVANLNADIKVNAYPNPVIDKLNLEISNATGEYGVRVFDMNGKIVAEQTTSGNSAINTSGWAPGLYQVQLSKDGVKQTIAILK